MSVAPPTGELRGPEAPGAHPATGAMSAPETSPAKRTLLQAGRTTLLPRHFAWRLLLLRFLVNAVSLAFTAIIVPHIYFAGNYRILTWLLVSAAFGLLNAFVKPLVQVVMLPFMFVSYGLVVVLINAIMLWMLDVIFPTRFIVDHLLWALIGGIVFGLLSGFFENLLGLTPPIFEGEPEARVEEIERHKCGLVETQILAATAGPVAAEAATTPPPTDSSEGDESAVTEVHEPGSTTDSIEAAEQ